jgi:Domain of unknown function (DUF4375)
MGKIFLEPYGGETIDELLAMKVSHRIDSLVLAIDQALDMKRREDLSHAERVVLAVEALEREVNNGGYHQFFLNSSREFTPFIVQALELIGCPKCAAITASAIAVLDLPDQVDVDAVHEAASQLSDENSGRLGEADSQYYENDENIEQNLLAYMERHPKEIELPHTGLA